MGSSGYEHGDWPRRKLDTETKRLIVVVGVERYIGLPTVNMFRLERIT
jgi:hypothetical protein